MRGQTVVLAIVGCGKVADFAHFPALSKLEGVIVKYACDLVPQRAQWFMDKYPQLVEQVITNYHMALEDPEVDAVYVLTPVTGHYGISLDALHAGKHVFCENPYPIIMLWRWRWPRRPIRPVSS